MTEAYIFDAVRTPRGKGKKDGGLHQATPVWLLRTLLKALQQRNQLDTARRYRPHRRAGRWLGAKCGRRDALALLRFRPGGREPGYGQDHVRHGGHGRCGRCRIHEPLGHGQ